MRPRGGARTRRITRRWSGPRRRYTSLAAERRACAAAAAQRPYVMRRWSSHRGRSGRAHLQLLISPRGRVVCRCLRGPSRRGPPPHRARAVCSGGSAPHVPHGPSKRGARERPSPAGVGAVVVRLRRRVPLDALGVPTPATCGARAGTTTATGPLSHLRLRPSRVAATMSRVRRVAVTPGPPHNPPMQRTGAAGIVSLIR
jgi:hypothetical protein